MVRNNKENTKWVLKSGCNCGICWDYYCVRMFYCINPLSISENEWYMNTQHVLAKCDINEFDFKFSYEFLWKFKNTLRRWSEIQNNLLDVITIVNPLIGFCFYPNWLRNVDWKALQKSKQFLFQLTMLLTIVSWNVCKA